jgi:hypothetical protein
VRPVGSRRATAREGTNPVDQQTRPAGITLATWAGQVAAEAVHGNFLDAARVTLWRDDQGLWLGVPGQPPARVTAVRPAFPLSRGVEMLVLYGYRPGTDARNTSAGDSGRADRTPGEELGILRSLEALPAGAQELLAEEIAKAYFVPRIIRIVAIEEEFGVQRWEVLTDRGPRTFEVTERSSIRPLDHGRVVIKDVDGNRYQIEDVRKLDRRSQQLLDLQI